MWHYATFPRIVRALCTQEDDTFLFPFSFFSRKPEENGDARHIRAVWGLVEEALYFSGSRPQILSRNHSQHLSESYAHYVTPIPSSRTHPTQQHISQLSRTLTWTMYLLPWSTPRRIFYPDLPTSFLEISQVFHVIVTFTSRSITLDGALTRSASQNMNSSARLKMKEAIHQNDLLEQSTEDGYIARLLESLHNDEDPIRYLLKTYPPSSSLPAHPLHRPQDIQLNKKIGEGAYGSVYLAEYHGYPVACKVIKAGLNRTNAERLLDELRVMKYAIHRVFTCETLECSRFLGSSNIRMSCFSWAHA